MTLVDAHKISEAVLRTQQEYFVANRIMYTNAQKISSL